MIRSSVIFVAFLLVVPVVDGYAETYAWTDEQGTQHFTEDPGKVPKAVRANARRGEDLEASPEGKPSSAASSAKDADAMLQVAPAVGMDEPTPSEIYDGRTYEQWEKDFADREVAMISIRKRIDEIAAILSTLVGNLEKQRELLAEHKSLQAKFKEMKTRYFQLVEIARKAGLQINIQQ